MTKPILVFGFDDGTATDYSIAYPELLARGIKGTSWINGSSIGKPGIMTWAQVMELANHPEWDVQCHSYNHVRLNELSDEELRLEMTLQNEAFILNGLPPPKHHAYPYGEFDSRVASTVLEYRLTARRTGWSADHINKYETLLHDIRNGTVKAINADVTSAERRDELCRFVDIAMETNGIVIFYGHEILPAHKQWWLDVFDHIEASGITTMTISELYDYYMHYADLFL